MDTAPGFVERDKIDYIDVATNQAFLLLRPCFEHNDANRAPMASNMQAGNSCIVSEIRSLRQVLS